VYDTESRLIRLGDAAAKVHVRAGPGGEPQPWFQAKPIALHLGYTSNNAYKAINRVHEDYRKSLGELVGGTSDLEVPLGHNDSIATYLSEPGLFELLVKSEMPAARPFQRWLFEEVLPTIRRTGSYALVNPLAEREMVDLRAELQRLREGQASQSVLVVSRGGAGDCAEQKWLLEHGRDASADQDTFLAQRPLDLAGYLGSRLPADQHWVIRHVKCEFARECKRRRVALYERTGDRFWVAHSQAQWRIAYVAADTDILDQVWAEEATQQYLERQLRSCRLASCSRAPARMLVAHGPYRRPPQGGSAHVTREAMANMFRVADR
jgi:prophage antirepressor-like protein